MNHCRGKVHQPALAFVAGFVGAFVWIFVDMVGIFEVETVLLQVGLPLCLVPGERYLIVATIKTKCKPVCRCRASPGSRGRCGPTRQRNSSMCR